MGHRVHFGPQQCINGVFCTSRVRLRQKARMSSRKAMAHDRHADRVEAEVAHDLERLFDAPGGTA